jgi:hypothetical protein
MTVWFPAFKVVVTVVINSSSFTAIGSSLLQDENVDTNVSAGYFFKFFIFFVFTFNNWILIEFESSYPFHPKSVAY